MRPVQAAQLQLDGVIWAAAMVYLHVAVVYELQHGAEHPRHLWLATGSHQSIKGHSIHLQGGMPGYQAVMHHFM